MRKMFFMFISILILAGISLHAEVPTKDSVTKLYVATFNRAPDAAGLNYWLNDSGLQLEQIAQSFFDQTETQEAYPPGSTNADFIEAVYLNLFNRVSDQGGFLYWIEELNSGRIPKSFFILAMINGAQNTVEFGNDATILANKMAVGLAFANAGLNDTADARDIMLGVTDDEATIMTALDAYGIGDGSSLSELEALLAGKTFYSSVYNADTLESLTFSQDLTAFTWVELVDGVDTGSGTLSIDDMNIDFTDGDVTVSLVVTEILEDYLLASLYGVVTRRVYFDEAKARAYFLAVETACPLHSEGGSNTWIGDSQNGYYCEYFPEGQLWVETPWVQGTIHGTILSFYVSGIVNIKKDFWNGVKTKEVVYYPSGDLYSCNLYEDGNLIGWCDG